MKCNLKLVGDGICLEIKPESDVETIALRAWSDKFFPVETPSKGAYLLILAVAEHSVQADLATPSNSSESAQNANPLT